MVRVSFEERNRDTYVKAADVPEGTIKKYEGLLPKELIDVWRRTGFGIYEGGFLQLVDPGE